jgi:hypothetical protein
MRFPSYGFTAVCLLLPATILLTVQVRSQEGRDTGG